MRIKPASISRNIGRTQERTHPNPDRQYRPRSSCLWMGSVVALAVVVGQAEGRFGTSALPDALGNDSEIQVCRVAMPIILRLWSASRVRHVHSLKLQPSVPCLGCPSLDAGGGDIQDHGPTGGRPSRIESRSPQPVRSFWQPNRDRMGRRFDDKASSLVFPARRLTRLSGASGAGPAVAFDAAQLVDLLPSRVNLLRS